PPADVEKFTGSHNSSDSPSTATKSGYTGYGLYSRIKNVWRKLFGLDLDAKRARLPEVAEHAKQLQEWSNRKSRTIGYMGLEEIEALRLEIVQTLVMNDTSQTRAEELTATLGKNLAPIDEPAESRIDAILAEITQAHARGVLWNTESQSWE